MPKLVSLLVPVTLLLAACGGPSEFKAEANASAEAMFAAACVKCHGERGQGKWGFLLKIAGSAKGKDELAAVLHSGGKLMPSFPNLSQDQRLALVDYLKSQR
jgi:mono/diheme cytochrome c family protein